MGQEERTQDVERTQALQARTGEFTLSLVKALLQTGYYSSEHPLAKVASKELHGQFQEITRDAFEISYVLLSATDDRGIMVDGLLSEPIEVAKVLTGTMGDHFVKKFHDYFLSNKIASFTIKRGIPEKEFESFMDLWVTWASKVAQADESRSSVEVMSDELTRAGIFSVTVVSMSDVPGSVRQLSWPVKISMGRLQTDLARLPQMSKVRPETMPQLKAQAVADVMRALTKPEFLRDIILNADLVVEDLTSFSKMEIEDALIAAVPTLTLVPLTAEFMELRRVCEQGERNLSLPGRDILEYKEAVDRSVRKILVRLAAHHELEQDDDLLLEAHKEGLVPQEDLPEAISRRIKAGELADRFLKTPDMYLRDFEQCAGPKSYLKYLNVLSLIIPVFVDRGETEVLSSIFSLLHKHKNEEVPPFVGRARFLDETMTVIERTGCLSKLIQLAGSTPKEERQMLESGVAMFGERAVSDLVRLLSSSEDVSTRKAACSMLESIGEDGIARLVEELDSHRHPWFAVRNIITLLGELRARDALESIKQYGSHPHSKVREESVHAIGKIMGDEGENELLRHIGDKDPSVIRKVILHLGTIRSCEPSLLQVMNETIRLRTRKETEPEELAQAACLTALARYNNAPLPGTPNLEATLCDILRPSKMKTMLPGRMGVRAKSKVLQILALQALGAIGSSRCLSLLSGFSKAEEDVKEAASEAAEQIRNRQTSQTVQKPLKY